MAPNSTVYGKRLLPSLVDEIAARDPDRPWVSLPKAQSLEDGFQDLSYQCLANAINRLAWWLEATMGKSQDHETLAYLGPPDVRYYVVCMMAAKVGYKAFFPSPRNSLEGHITLLQSTQCSKFLVSPGTDVDGITSSLDMQVRQISSLEECFDEEKVDVYPFTETWETASKNPIAVLHTSGSTGIPKPIVITHEHMAAVDKYHFLPSIDGQPYSISLLENKRVLSFMPPFHAAGLIGCGLASGIFLNATFVFGPPQQPADAGKLEQMIKYGNAAGCIVPPSVLEDACKFLPALERISSLEFVMFGGGPLGEEAGDKIAPKSQLVDVVGSTEIGNLPEVLPEKKEDWKVHHFHPRIGCHFRHHLDDLYEMIITRDDSLSPYNSLPNTFSGKGEYAMRDLYSHPPGSENGWVYRGRIDDVIVLSNGEKFNPVDIESHISNCSDVRSAIVVGSGKFQPAALIELADDSELWRKPYLERVNSIWKYIDEANTCAPAHGRLMREYILFATKEKPFQRLPKGTVQRQMSTKQYDEEIKKLYESMESEDPADLEVCIEWGDKKSVDESIYSLILQAAPQGEPGREDVLFDHGFDSMQIVKLTRSLRNALRTTECDATQPELQRMVYANPSSSQLSDALWDMLHHTDGGEKLDTQKQEIKKVETSLSDLVRALPQPNSKAPISKPKKACVILTGSTGSLGSYILNTLLKTRAVSSIICLNRSPNSIEKQKTSFSSRGLRSPLQQVNFLHADFSKPDLGLQPQDYNHLLEKATHIIHNAWQVDFNLPFSYYKKSHLQGVLHLIQLTSKAQHSPQIQFLSSISTVSQWATSTNGTVPEEPFHSFTSAAPMGYAYSKLVSEMLLEQATQKSHIKAAVCRIGQIAGPVLQQHSRGQWNVSEWFPSLILSSQEMGKLPKSLGSMARIDWVPIDLVSQIIVELLLSPASSDDECKVYHIINPSPTTWRTLLPTIQSSLSTPPSTISLPDWLSTLQTSSSSSSSNATKLLPFYQEIADQDPAQQTVLDTTVTKKYSKTLKGLKPVSEEWMRLWMRQWGMMENSPAPNTSATSKIWNTLRGWLPFRTE